MFFSGEYRMSMDEKGRLRIPNRIRTQIIGDYIIYAGTEGCLVLQTAEDFNAKYSALNQSIPLSDFAKQNALRKLFSTIQTPEEDSQGRFILQAKLKAMANISKKVVFLGIQDRVEIWAEDIYDKRFSLAEIDVNEAYTTLGI